MKSNRGKPISHCIDCTGLDGCLPGQKAMDEKTQMFPSECPLPEYYFAPNDRKKTLDMYWFQMSKNARLQMMSDAKRYQDLLAQSWIEMGEGKERLYPENPDPGKGGGE